MNSRHLQFCLNYLQTHDPGVAYKMTYPKASDKSVYAAASRLMARPDVSAWIRETEERVHERALREIEQEQGDMLKEQLLTINQKRAVLTKIITGETKRVRHIKTKYSYERVEDDLPVYAVLRAIDMDTRLENFYKLLSNPVTWHRAQTVYVNTPTLQQQVNVLINQTTKNAEETAQHELSTIQENSPLERGVGVCPLPQENTTIQKNSPIEEGGAACGGGCSLAQDENTHSVFAAPRLSTTLTQKKLLVLSPLQGDRGNTLTKKTPHYLTILNKRSPKQHVNSSETIQPGNVCNANVPPTSPKKL